MDCMVLLHLINFNDIKFELCCLKHIYFPELIIYMAGKLKNWLSCPMKHFGLSYNEHVELAHIIVPF